VTAELNPPYVSGGIYIPTVHDITVQQYEQIARIFLSKQYRKIHSLLQRDTLKALKERFALDAQYP